LAEILEYLSKDSPRAVQRHADQIQKKAEQLSAFPYLGREISPGIRTIVPHQYYLLTYRLKPDSIEVLQLRHVARKR
jgi:plasmid stabilization system protein ParE